MNEKAQRFILRQLEQISDKYGPTFDNEGKFMCFCPVHDPEHLHLAVKPALTVNTTNPDIPLGYAYCYSCGYKADYNSFAKLVGIKRLKASEMYDETAREISENDLLDLGLTYVKKRSYKSSRKHKSAITELPADAIEWNPKEDWRTISGQLLSDIGALKMMNAHQYIALFLPVYMEDTLKGGIECAMVKAKKGIPSYINTPGKWSRQALFPLDYVRTKFKKKKYLLLVEGPRDALFLIQNGIPAVAFLGSSTKWSNYLGNFITSMNIKYIVLAFDGDSPGQKATKMAYDFFKDKAKVKKITFAEDEDPASLTSKRIRQIKHKLETLV